MEEIKYHTPPKRFVVGDDVNFKVVVPFYNGKKYLEKCLLSLESQTYKNFQVVVIDDASDEFGIKSMALDFCRRNNWKIIFNNKNKGILENRIIGSDSFHKYNNEDVIVALDGDDWLKDNALEIINDYYKNYDTWLTYGSHIQYPENIYGINNGKLLKQVVDNNAFRETRWCYSHLRTFKKFLWDRVLDCDLRDSNGEYFQMTSDLAFMYPMLEMAGDHITNVEEVIYVYNMENPLNDHKKNPTLQQYFDNLIRSKEKYKRL